MSLLVLPDTLFLLSQLKHFSGAFSLLSCSLMFSKLITSTLTYVASDTHFESSSSARAHSRCCSDRAGPERSSDGNGEWFSCCFTSFMLSYFFALVNVPFLMSQGAHDYSLKLWDFGGMNETLQSFRDIEVEEGHPVRMITARNSTSI